MARIDFNREWFIYALTDSGNDFYVGRTFNIAQRLRGHRHRFGRHIEIRILESGRGKPEAMAAEIRWIESMLAGGVKLANRFLASSGVWQTSASALERITQHSREMWKDPAYREKQRVAYLAAISTPEFRKRKSDAAKKTWEGQNGARMRAVIKAANANREWTPEQRKAVGDVHRGKSFLTEDGRQRLRLKGGEASKKGWAEKSLAQREAHKSRTREAWKDPDRRARMTFTSERMREIWTKRPTEKRIADAARGAETRRKNCGPERLSEIGRKGGAAALAKHPNAMSQNISKFWQDIRKDPERYRQYIDNRAKRISEARIAKRTNSTQERLALEASH